MRIVHTDGDATNFQIENITIYRPLLALTGETEFDTGTFERTFWGFGIPEAQNFTLTNNSDTAVTGVSISEHLADFDVSTDLAYGFLDAGASAKITVVPLSDEYLGAFTDLLTATGDGVDGSYDAKPIALSYFVTWDSIEINLQPGMAAVINGVHVTNGPIFIERGNDVEFSVTPPSPYHIAIWAVDDVPQSGDSRNTFTVNVQNDVEVSVGWLRIGAVSTGGVGNVTSTDIIWLARHVVGHSDFAVLPDNRIGNLLGLDRAASMADVTQLAQWLSGHDINRLRNQTLS
jgi:hypothetical protein